MTVDIEGVQLHLSHPDELAGEWVGQEEVMRQLLAAWLIVDPLDVPMNPRLLGKPGTCRSDNRAHLGQGDVELFINNNILELRGVRDFPAGSQQPARDHVLRVLPPLRPAEQPDHQVLRVRTDLVRADEG